MAVNCYLVWDEVSREAALFDTGWNARDALAGSRRTSSCCVTCSSRTRTTITSRAWTPAQRSQSPGSHELEDRARGPAEPPNECVPLGSLRISHRETPGTRLTA